MVNAFSSASELATAMRLRRVSAAEVTQMYLARIATHNPELNAVVTLDEAGARERAAQADAALGRAGAARGRRQAGAGDRSVYAAAAVRRVIRGNHIHVRIRGGISVTITRMVATASRMRAKALAESSVAPVPRVVVTARRQAAGAAGGEFRVRVVRTPPSAQEG